MGLISAGEYSLTVGGVRGKVCLVNIFHKKTKHLMAPIKSHHCRVKA